MKKIIALVLALAMVFAFAACAAPAPAPETDANQTKDLSFKFTVVDLEGKSQEFDVPYAEGDTVGEAIEAEGIASDVVDGLINTVNGVTLDYNKDNAYWAFYVNDEMYMQGGAYDVKISSDETYKFVATDASSFG